MYNLSNSHAVPEAFKSYPQFVVWKLVQKSGESKPAKVPFDPKTGNRASPTDPTTWADYGAACRVWSAGAYNGIGFVFTACDPFAFVDLDGCCDSATGKWTDEARAVAAQFSGAAMEVSQSGTGCHIVGSVTDKSLFRDRRNKWGGRFECYFTDRFMAISRNGWQGDATVDITTALQAWLPTRGAGKDGRELPVGRDPRWCGPEDDGELVQRMLAAGELTDEQTAHVLGNPHDLANLPALKRHERHELVYALWTKHDSMLGRSYPSSQTGKSFDHSAADQALMNALAFWTGCDHERMVRLFGKSALGNREKWTSRPDYRNNTASKATSNCRDVYTGTREERRQRQREENERIGENLGYATHSVLMSLPEMIDDLWFIGSGSGGGSVANAKTGWCTTIAIARNEYAASTEAVTYTDKRNGQEKTKQVPVIELWLSNPRRKRADAITWKPVDDIVCDVPEQPGATGFNTWRGLIKPKWGDEFHRGQAMRERWMAAWHNHLAYLVPFESERRLFEQWLAHIVQRPGDVPQTGWCFIAANTGIGRNWLGSVLVRVLRGHVLANAILDGVLAGTFNGRMSRKLLIIVDEARAGMRGANAWQHSEKLKTIVNPELREINEKHGLQRAEHNAMRWLVFSNHWDALPIERDDRRWNVVENPTWRQSQCYYTQLYDQLRRDEFVAAIWAHLSTLSLQGFNHGALSLQNQARGRMLAAIASELELTLEEFRNVWCEPVAQFKDIESFVRHKHPVNTPNRKTIERDLAKIGMVYCRDRPQVGSDKIRFVIVKPDQVSERQVYDKPAHYLTIATNAAATFNLHRDQ